MGVIAVLGLAGCGQTDDKPDAKATTKTTPGAVAFSGDPSGPYCQEAAGWAAHELTPADDGDPAAFRTYWGEYVNFLNKAHAAAPADIKVDWDTYSRFMVGRFTPVLQKYGFDASKAQREGAPDEKALFEGPDETTGKAFDRILAYESEVCGSAQPMPAETRFSGSGDSAYCQAQKDNQEAFRSAADGWDPARVRAYFTGDGFSSYLDQLEKTAPAPIASDVRAHVAFTKSQFLPTLDKHSYDVKELLNAGTPEDRHVFNFATAAERGPFSRLAAYDMAVCQV